MNANKTNTLERPAVDAVVELAPGVAGVQAPMGGILPKEQLGPGSVLQIGEDGRLRVHWAEADLDTWVEPADVKTYGRNARLVAIYRLNSHGGRTLERYKVVSAEGLTHNWTVEWFPEKVIRTVRSDGLAWTFDWYPWLERAEPLHTILEDALADEDNAEALTVAELAAR